MSQEQPVVGFCVLDFWFVLILSDNPFAGTIALDRRE